MARVLAAEYGHSITPLNYIRGVGVSGRLRLSGIDSNYPDPAGDIAGMADPILTDEVFETLAGSDGSAHAGLVWASELSGRTGERRYADFLVRIADLYLCERSDGMPMPVDPDYRVEDIFFAAAVLGRAFSITGDLRYADRLASFLAAVEAQPDTGLWRHCGASPYYWGRGNGFAALGFVEALSYLPADHDGRAALVQTHRSHLSALLAHQDESGAWRQVIDRPDSYLELTATAMIGYSLARGVRRGWLGDGLRAAAGKAWGAVSERVDDGGMVADSCTGTGPLPALDDYLNRPREYGHDDRAGGFALWFAVEECVASTA